MALIPKTAPKRVPRAHEDLLSGAIKAGTLPMGAYLEVIIGAPYFRSFGVKDAKSKEEGIPCPARLYLRSLSMPSLAK